VVEKLFEKPDYPFDLRTSQTASMAMRIASITALNFLAIRFQ
jgi:hypothetical protein